MELTNEQIGLAMKCDEETALQLMNDDEWDVFFNIAYTLQEIVRTGHRATIDNLKFYFAANKFGDVLNYKPSQRYWDAWNRFNTLNEQR